MSDVSRYRQNAAECERLAERSTDPDNRDGFLKLAHEWRSLARLAESGSGAAASRSSADPDCASED